MKKLIKLKNKRGFTLIELLTVIAILGILVLLAAPKFLGYTEKAKIAQIQNDIKIVENHIELELMKDPDVNKTWDLIAEAEVDTIESSGRALDRKGQVVSNIGGNIYSLNFDEVDSNLNGKFLLNEENEVFYYDVNFKKSTNKIGDNSDSGNSDEDKLEFTPEIDFEFTKDPNNNGYEIEGKGTGYYKYIGTEDTVVIPHSIDGHNFTNYYKMFENSNVKKVVSSNPNVTSLSMLFYKSNSESIDLSEFNTSGVENMYGMFYEAKATTINLSNFETSNLKDMSTMFLNAKVTSLDLSSFDTSKVDSMQSTFYGIPATIGLVKTQADADKLNSSANKPATLKFVVK